MPGMTITLPDGTEHRHTKPELEGLRTEFTEWYFDPFKEGTQAQWALAHKVSKEFTQNVKKMPEFVTLLEDFRKTHRERGEAALQRLFRIAEEEPAKIAIPAIKIITEIMGYNAPLKMEITAKGMNMAEYLLYITKAKVEEEQRAALGDGNTLEGEFQEQSEVDAWETAA